MGRSMAAAFVFAVVGFVAFVSATIELTIILLSDNMSKKFCIAHTKTKTKRTRSKNNSQTVKENLPNQFNEKGRVSVQN